MIHPHVFIRVTWFIHMSSYVWHDSFTCLHTCDMLYWHVIHTCDMIYLHVFICVTWSIHMSFIRVTWFIYMYSYVWRDSFTCLHTCDMIHSHVFIRVTWFTHMYSYVWHDSLTCIHTCDMIHSHVLIRVTNERFIRMSASASAWRQYSAPTHTNELCHIHKWVIPHV